MRVAKDVLYNKKCSEIEELQEKNDTFNMYNKMEEMSTTHKSIANSLLDKQNIIVKEQDKLERWR